jgi:ribosome-associated protein
MKTEDTGAGAAGERPSKAQLKRETEALRELAKRLVALPSARLAKLALGDELREAVREAQVFERGALARQLRYLTGLLREVDAETIARELEELDQPRRAAARAFRQVEQWRDALVAGDAALLDDLRARFPSADHGRLRQLATAARAEHARGGPSKSGRQLFRYLSEMLEAS